MSAVRTDALKSIVAISVRDAGNDLVTVALAKVRDAANALKTFFSAMSAAAAPESVTGYGNATAVTEIGTPGVTCTPSGGVAPFTYLWERTDGGGQTWDITTETTASTGFTTEIAGGQEETATFRCTVTDDTGAEAVSNEILARAVNLGMAP